MAYAKLPKAIQDYGLGYQTVNQAKDNEAAYRTILDAKHHLNGLGSTLIGTGDGHHDDLRIPRAVALVEVSTVQVMGQTNAFAGYTILSNDGGILQPGGLQRLSQGAYFAKVGNVDDEDVWAEITPESTGSETRLANSRFVSAASGALVFTGFLIQLLEGGAAGAAFALADYSFTLHVFSTT